MAAASPVSSPRLPDVNPPPSRPSMSSSKPLYPSSAVASAPSAASTAPAPPQPQVDEDWLYQHHLCETAMDVTRLVFRGEEGEEWNEDDQVPSAAGTVLLNGNGKTRRVRVGRGRAARAASRAAKLGETATDGWSALLRPKHYNPYAASGNGKGMLPSFHLPSAPSAAGELAPLPGLAPPPGLAPLSTTTTTTTTTMTAATVAKDRSSNKHKKEGWMEGVSKRAFYKRRRKARQAAEYVVDCVLEEVERRVLGLEIGAMKE